MSNLPLPGPAAAVLAWLLPVFLCCAFAAPRHGLDIEQAYPHASDAYTQGLVHADGVLFESTGRYGASDLRRVSLETGEVLMQRKLDKRYFGEGLALVGDRLIQLTWKAGRGFVYDHNSLERLDSFEYEGEGWGLAYDGERLIMSDGSNRLRFVHPETFASLGSLEVTLDGEPVQRLNELEVVENQIWANVWPSDFIVRIDPASGRVVGIVNGQALRAALPAGYEVDALNGIAYDSENKRLFMTGKLWPRLFEVKLQALTGD